MPAIRPHLLVAALLLAGSATAALADPPGRVGRVSLVEGAMSMQSAEQPQWAPAGINFPVTAGETFWTESQSRGEIEIGAAELRLDAQTELSILRLDDGSAVIRVDQGVINLHLVVMPPGGLQVITRAGQLDLLQPGSYHVDAGRPGPDGTLGNTEMNVLDGAARLAGPRTAVDIQPGEGAVIPADLSTLTLIAGGATPFDNWALSRERRETALQSTQYLSPDTTGYQDLDSYGSWGMAPGYGPAWYPAVGSDWAPYRNGHWAYVAPWGWTWIDDAPWGFAPFHYGRWVDVGDRWAWLPDPINERPIYAPALVVFVGGSDRPVGWVPLGPHEVFRPYYAASEAYVRRLNGPHFGGAEHAALEEHANRRAMTTIPEAAFRSAAPVERARISAPAPMRGQQEPQRQPEPQRLPMAPAHPGTAQPSPGPIFHAPDSPAAHAPGSAAFRTPEPRVQEAPRPQPAASVQWHQPQGQQPPQAAQIQHPVQPARLAPTPQGWTREAPHQAAPQQQPHGQNHQDERERH